MKDQVQANFIAKCMVFEKESIRRSLKYKKADHTRSYMLIESLTHEAAKSALSLQAQES